MRKLLLLAALLAGCDGDRADVVHADDLEQIRVDAVAQTMNLTVVSSDGRRTTIVFTPATAVRAQEAMARTLLLTVQSDEAIEKSSLHAAP